MGNPDEVSPLPAYDVASADLEKSGHAQNAKLPDLQRRLKARHLQMIAIGAYSLSADPYVPC